MATVQEKLKYLINTKDIIKRKIQYFVIMPDWTPFRKYADYIGLIGTNFCACETDVKYIPAPRIRTSHTVTINNLEHDTIVRRTIRNLLNVEKTVTIPSITHETEVI